MRKSELGLRAKALVIESGYHCLAFGVAHYGGIFCSSGTSFLF